MADLPDCRLCIRQPAFFFKIAWIVLSQYVAKIFTPLRKTMEIDIHVYMTTKAVPLEILASMDADTFLMAVRFSTQRGTLKQLLSDCSTNFTGAETELTEWFNDLSKESQEKLVERQVEFYFNLPSPPHFENTWNIEVKSIKNALRIE